MNDGPVLIASNRGPVSFSRGDGGTLSARRGGGGLVSGLSAVAGDSDVLWTCAALSDADRIAASRAPGGRLDLTDAAPELGPAKVRMLDIPPATFQRAYNGIANSTLWFVHHLLYDTPTSPQFGIGWRREWESYRTYNAAFARALTEDAAAAGDGKARAMVQDYHLTLVPQMLREARPGLRIAHFSHTPWAPPDYFRMLPGDVGQEVLGGLLGADYAGFLSGRWARAFLRCCAEFLDATVDAERGMVSYRGRTTRVGVHGLGVDAAWLRERGSAADVTDWLHTLRENVGGRRLIVRVDRAELSKNILRGLSAYRELLATRPEWRGKVVHLATAYPSRHDLPEYREYTAAVQRSAQQIRDEFGTADWDPLILEVNDNFPRSLASYRLADVLLVNPIRDGMNLVAKEGPVLSERGCALVLSREAGAADELGGDALLVNPYDVSGTAAALHQALSMPAEERQQRRDRLAAAAAAMPPQRWFADQLAALDAAAPG